MSDINFENAEIRFDLGKLHSADGHLEFSLTLNTEGVGHFSVFAYDNKFKNKVFITLDQFNIIDLKQINENILSFYKKFTDEGKMKTLINRTQI